ncbi:hypothetical protein IYC_08090, partial [Clostridium sporogenes PA 3679]
VGVKTPSEAKNSVYKQNLKKIIHMWISLIAKPS